MSKIKKVKKKYLKIIIPGTKSIFYTDKEKVKKYLNRCKKIKRIKSHKKRKKLYKAP